MSNVRFLQEHQPWTVPYTPEVAACRERMAAHNVLHAAKTVGRLAAVFEDFDHGGVLDTRTISDMSADLLSEALRFANLYGFDLESELRRRVAEKNGVSYPTEKP
jgi:sugar phosphate isomerase/epimerase